MISFTQRIALTLPPWWGTAHPHLDGLIAGYAAGHLQLSAQITAVRPLMRLATTTGELLDIAAYDFFGDALGRRVAESDTLFRARIQAALFSIQGTRPAFIATIRALTGNAPVIIDPRQPNDTGVLGNIGNGQVPTVFYNSAGHDCWTNTTLHHQWFVRLTGTGLFTAAQMLRQVAAIMPAGTVCWTNMQPDPHLITYNGEPVTYMGQLVTYGA